MLPLRLFAVILTITTFATLSLSPLQIAAAEEDIRVWFSDPRDVEPGSILNLSLMMTSSQQLGGVDFRIRYNDSLLSFLSVEQDTGLNNWEYFQSSHNDSLNTVRIFSIADAGSLFIQPDSSDLHPKGSIARYRFFVSPNWLADSGRVLFDFLWPLCGSNAVSNSVGDTLIIVRRIYNENSQLIWDETDNVAFPEQNRPLGLGVSDTCLAAESKIAMKVDFYFGEATNYYICGDADGGGTVSVTDAVWIINYIFSGGPPPNPLEAGDVDCSGQVSVSDAVAIINYIFGGGDPPCSACP